MSDELRRLCYYIISKDKKEEISLLKLNKILYMIQASSLVYLDKPCFPENFKAGLLGGFIIKKKIDYENLKATYYYNDCEIYDDCIKTIVDTILTYTKNISSMDLAMLISSYECCWKNYRDDIGFIDKYEIKECHQKIAKEKNGFIF